MPLRFIPEAQRQNANTTHSFTEAHAFHTSANWEVALICGRTAVLQTPTQAPEYIKASFLNHIQTKVMTHAVIQRWTVGPYFTMCPGCASEKELVQVPHPYTEWPQGSKQRHYTGSRATF